MFKYESKALKCYVVGSTTQVCNGMVGTDKTGMAIVPVNVNRKGSGIAVITCAFLDSGSSATFCTESLIRQLDDCLNSLPSA